MNRVVKRPKIGGDSRSTISKKVQVNRLGTELNLRINSVESEGWSESQFQEYLKTNTLGRYLRILDIVNRKKALASTSHPLGTESLPLEVQMFEKHQVKKNVLALVHAPVDQLVELLTLPENST